MRQYGAAENDVELQVGHFVREYGCLMRLAICAYDFNVIVLSFRKDSTIPVLYTVARREAEPLFYVTKAMLCLFTRVAFLIDLSSCISCYTIAIKAA